MGVLLLRTARLDHTTPDAAFLGGISVFTESLRRTVQPRTTVQLSSTLTHPGDTSPVSHYSDVPKPAPVTPERIRGEDAAFTATRSILSVAETRQRLPLSNGGVKTIREGRDAFRRILHGEDRRTVVIVGPCSIHDPDAALEYAARLKTLSAEVNDRVLLMMRVYLEKPRTSVGWKGLLSDPHLDASQALEDGLLISRRLLCSIADLGVPAATEFLDPLIPAYLGELVSWVAIGARTTESQTHRQMASGLPAPVGFKNATDGCVEVAINAIKSAREPQVFLGMDEGGHIGAVETRGNADTHVVLRGANTANGWQTNYHRAAIADVETRLSAAGLPLRLMIDCSHANCGYDFHRQASVADDWIAQRRRGESASAFGLMLESNLVEGKQAFTGRARLKPGVSITDGCIGWSDTEAIVRRIHSSDLPAMP